MYSTSHLFIKIIKDNKYNKFISQTLILFLFIPLNVDVERSYSSQFSQTFLHLELPDVFLNLKLIDEPIVTPQYALLLLVIYTL